MYEKYRIQFISSELSCMQENANTRRLDILISTYVQVDPYRTYDDDVLYFFTIVRYVLKCLIHFQG